MQQEQRQDTEASDVRVSTLTPSTIIPFELQCQVSTPEKPQSCTWNKEGEQKGNTFYDYIYNTQCLNTLKFHRKYIELSH